MATITAIFDQALAHLLAPVKPFLDDASVSEIMINGHDEVFVERGGKLQKTEARFADEAELESAMRGIAQFVGKRLTPEFPSIEARLPDGSRVHIVQRPAARKGLCATIRKFSRMKLDLAALVKAGAMTEQAAEFLGLCVALARNVIVSGGTGSGKTTLLNCLSAMIPPDERILVLEDSSELQLQQEHVVPFEVQPADRNGRGGIGIRELFRASLRMRPDRVIVGECRGGEALDMIQAMTSGHSGSLSTCHATTPRDALNRLETMALMSGVQIPLFALRAQVASAIDIVVQINRFHDGSRRLTHITEVLDLGEDGGYQVQDLFQLRGRPDGEAADRELQWTGVAPTFWQAPSLAGLDMLVHLTTDIWQPKE